jgi:peptide/nickel transport system substrate-binding protein
LPELFLGGAYGLKSRGFTGHVTIGKGGNYLKISKMVLVPIALLILMALLIGGCSTKTTTNTAATTTAPTTQTTTTTATTATTTTTKPTPTPVYGGILRIVSLALPKNIGYQPEMAPADNIAALPVLERLCEWDAAGNQIPVLATSWVADAATNTLTWKIRQGVKFTDGTDLNAEAVRWNFQQSIDTKSGTDTANIKSVEVVDPYTVRMNLVKLTSMSVENYGWRTQSSPTAFETAGGTIPAKSDIEKSKAWARLNSVGTGPFKVTDFKRDVSLTYSKNTNYWRPGLPYLDGMVTTLIPDVMTASATMESKQGDMWIDVAAVTNIKDLTSKGLLTNWGPGMFYALLPSSSNPASPTAKKAVREAIEYAIDRPSLANMIGQGVYEPLTQIAPQKFPGYVAGYNPRPFNVAKAKQLLADAGYPNGFKTKIMTTATGVDAVTAIKAYLAEVGIDATIDIADLGRYFGELFGPVGTVWSDDLVWSASGINPDGTDLFVHYGPSPMTFKTGSIYKSPEYLALCQKALETLNWPDAVKVIQQAVRQAGEDAMIVPVYRSAANSVMQPYVHSDYFNIHGVIWTSYDDWMDKH